MTREEQRLAELLHGITPEPPRRVTVEDIAFRLANQAGRGHRASYRPLRGRAGRDGQPGYREPRRRPRRGRVWAPVLAAASVFVVAGTSASLAIMATSHNSPKNTGAPGPASVPAATSAPAQVPTTAGPAQVPARIPHGPWGAELIDRQVLVQGSLVGSGDSLYAFTGQDLVRIDPSTGGVVATTAYRPPLLNPPVILGSTVWVVWSYSGGLAVLHGYDAQTLAQVASVTVPALGPVASVAQGVLTAGPGGRLYLAAGDSVAIVDPASGTILRRIQESAGPIGSVAVSADGSRLYTAIVISSGQAFRLLTYDPAMGVVGVQVGASGSSDGAGGNLVATNGGVWGTLGSGNTESVFFAAGGDLSSASPVIQAAGGGFASLPALANGTVWVGGSQALSCADPATGRVWAQAPIAADNGVAEYFSSLTFAGGRAYSYYIDNRTGVQGVAELNPPAACGPGS